MKRAKQLNTGALPRMQYGRWKSLDELMQVYESSSLPEPTVSLRHFVSLSVVHAYVDSNCNLYDFCMICWLQGHHSFC